ncbi:MAG: YhdP family protein [Methylophilaceae bacterium]
MVKKSLLRLYRIFKWLMIVGLLVVLVAALTIQFYVFPHIDEYKSKIAQFASTTTKQKVEIGNIKANWQGLNPHLSVDDIKIFDAQNRPALELNNTDVIFSWLSIAKFEPYLAALTIRAPELTIRRNTQGQIFVAGIQAEGKSKPDLANWLLRQSQFEIKNAKITWLDEMRNAPPLSLDNLNLQVSSPPWVSLLKKHRISLSALPSAGTHHPININAIVYGNDISAITQWHGNIDADLKDADLVAFKPWLDYPALTQPMDLIAGNGSAQVSLQFADHQVQSLNSNVSLDHVEVQLRTQEAPVKLNKLAGQLNWINTKNTQKVNIENLTLLASNGLALNNVTGSFSENKTGQRTLDFKLPKLDLTLVQPYLLQLPMPAEPMQKLTLLSPRGKLNQLSVSWHGSKTETNAYKISTNFDGLSINAHEKLPGFSNLTGEINANETAGKMTLRSTKAFLDFKNILRWPIPADKLDGDISWTINQQANNIEIKNLTISNAHLAGTLNAHYLMDGNKGGLLDLTGKFGNGNAKYAPFYYPIMLHEATLNWLDSSILSGRAEDINLTVKGRLADFPFVNKQNNTLNPKLGLFRVTAKISNGDLEFGKNWPIIKGIGLGLLFEGKRMELNTNAGDILGNKITQCKTTIAQLDAPSPLLEINGEINGPVANGIEFVNKSPVANVTQGFTEDLKTNGQGKLNLGLKIPLHDVEAAQIKGLYLINNGSMQSESIPTLTNINGALEFTEHDLSGKNLTASAFGSPVSVALNTNKDKSVHVLAKGKINEAAIKQMLLSQSSSNQNLAKAGNYLAGSTDWTGDILIQKPNVNINIQSDLAGISSSLPAPFSKPANEKLNLVIDKKLTPNSDFFALTLGNKLVAKLLRSGEKSAMKIERGVIQLNASTATLNPSIELNNVKGLQVLGNIDYLDGDAWLTIFNELTGDSNTNSQKPIMLPLEKVAIQINALDIFNKRINSLKISHNTNKDYLSATVQSREISGDLQWISQGNGKLIARLSQLTVPEPSPNQIKANTTNSNTLELNKVKQNYPALDITASNFTMGKKTLGALELIAKPQGDNWNIEKLKLASADSVISASGQWNNWIKSPNTYLNIDWDIKNLGKTLNSVSYPDAIKGGEGTLKAQLQWPGSPNQFNTKGLNGELQLDMKKGQFLKAQPGVGRLLGLLSLQSLPRRLTLDFRDLFSDGFAFDDIGGSAKISQGVMRSENFSMSGPAADVSIKGETNLQAETQHLNIKVTPHVSDSVSLAAFAGGPIAGVVAFVAQKILKDPLNKIASSEYEIVGTWDNPQEVNAPKTSTEPHKNSPLQQTK